MDQPDLAALPARGAALVATWWRWVSATAALMAATIAAAEVYASWSRSRVSLVSRDETVASVCALGAALVWWTLRAQELRLSRELRTARTGTSVARAAVVQRRRQASIVGRLLSTRLGTAAVFLADGDRSDALDSLRGESPLMRGGRLEKLREVVHADADRAMGTSGGRELCMQRLQGMARIGNREADLYRTHVLVKALLQQGDPVRALDLVQGLHVSLDEEERIYAVWLRVWFELDSDEHASADGKSSGAKWSPLSDGDLRLAALLARAHGAETLVHKLEARLTAIARSSEGE